METKIKLGMFPTAISDQLITEIRGGSTVVATIGMLTTLVDL